MSNPRNQFTTKRFEDAKLNPQDDDADIYATTALRAIIA
jgi:hypothetical protein